MARGLKCQGLMAQDSTLPAAGREDSPHVAETQCIFPDPGERFHAWGERLIQISEITQAFFFLAARGHGLQ
jgi:hypothetical protein